MVRRSRKADVLTAILEQVFAVNGRVLQAGDAITGELGMTSARWQVLGALADRPGTVAEIARQRGLARQSVRQTVGRLRESGLVAAEDNPADRRAPLIRLTAAGRAVLTRIGPRQAAWANGLAAGLPAADLDATLRVLERLRSRLDAEQD